MALDALLETITRDGEAEAQRVVAEATARAQRLRAAADVDAEAASAAAIAADERDRSIALAARRAVVRAESNGRVLRAKARLLERVFAAAESAFPGYLESDSGRRVLAQFAAEALAYFPGEDVNIRCNSRLAQLLGGDVPPMAQIVADDSVPEGIIVETADGSTRIESTLSALMRRRRPELSIELMAAVRGRS
jgi:vacuolar-type H+-ATPase subunit E/Vma4